MRSIRNFYRDLIKQACFPLFLMKHRVPEHVEKDGLRQFVEFGERGAALGPQRLRPVQHIRNPPLLGQRGKWNGKIV